MCLLPSKVLELIRDEELVPINRLLRLFVENEILRLTVWDNPTNDLKRRSDPAGLLESAVAEVSRAATRYS